MSDKNTIESTVALLKQMCRFEGRELADEWGRVLAGMTNAEVTVALEYMREKYTSSYAPPFATFRAWGKGESGASTRRWWQTHDVIETTDSQGRAHVLCEERTDADGESRLVPILVPRERSGPPLRLSREEYAASVKALVESAVTAKGPTSQGPMARFVSNTGAR